MPTHYIGRQMLLLDLVGVADAQAVQAQAVRTFKEETLPRLDRLFDRLCPAGYTLSLDSLDLDLGQVAPGKLGDLLTEKLLQALESALSKAMETPARAAAYAQAQDTPAAGTQYATDAARQVGMWLTFLERGYLPGWNGLPDPRTWESRLLQSLADEPAWRGPLGTLLRRVPIARQRLVRQFSPELIRQLWGWSELPVWAYEAAEALDVIWEEWSVTERFQERLMEVLFSDETITPDSMARRLKTWWTASHIPVENALAQTREVFDHQEVTSEVRAVLTILSQGTDPDTPAAPAPLADKKPSLPLPEGLYVPHAGLVLLHPFLPTFFRAVGLLAPDEGTFLNETTQERGIHLLAYLATSIEAAPEYELPFVKLLCGWPLDLPVRRVFSLSETELYECNELLTAVVGYWEALKNTSPDGLREGFLQRPGKLTLKEDQWVLHIEQNALDILLDRLPWGLSLVKLPWMPEMVHVNWLF
ncbi:MAG: contractile injection system tape measure protein [Bacteroidia bacterium]|nr:contractile injection system tape measure protein [Bacteroidia bacterium]